MPKSYVVRKTVNVEAPTYYIDEDKDFWRKDQLGTYHLTRGVTDEPREWHEGEGWDFTEIMKTYNAQPVTDMKILPKGWSHEALPRQKDH